MALREQYPGRVSLVSLDRPVTRPTIDTLIDSLDIHGPRDLTYAELEAIRLIYGIIKGMNGRLRKLVPGSRYGKMGLGFFQVDPFATEAAESEAEKQRPQSPYPVIVRFSPTKERMTSMVLQTTVLNGRSEEPVNAVISTHGIISALRNGEDSAKPIESVREKIQKFAAAAALHQKVAPLLQRH